MDATDPVNKPLVKACAQWALVWLTFFPLVGVLVSIQFHNPEFLGGTSWFTFGRLRPVHTNGVIFGSFTTAFVGLLYYFVPRLCGTPLYKKGRTSHTEKCDVWERKIIAKANLHSPGEAVDLKALPGRHRSSAASTSSKRKRDGSMAMLHGRTRLIHCYRLSSRLVAQNYCRMRGDTCHDTNCCIEGFHHTPDAVWNV